MGSEERKIFIAFGIAAVYLGALMVYFVFNILRQQRKYKKLQKEKLITEIQTAERERNAIATELHNDIGPILSSIKMRLELINTNQVQELESVKLAINKSLSQLRSISKTLAPFSKLHNSFLDALKAYAQEVNIAGGLRIEIVELDTIQLSVEQNNQLYRMLQEIIQNTIKHAKASYLKMEISKEEDMMLIRTADDGVGYKMDNVRDQHKLGLGLIGIYSRVEFLNGSISKDDGKRPGTRYNIRIPIHA